MLCDTFWLPKSVIVDDKSNQITILQVHIFAKMVLVGASQYAAETMGIWLVICGLTTQRKDNEV
jgi:hypothetical protein